MMNVVIPQTITISSPLILPMSSNENESKIPPLYYIVTCRYSTAYASRFSLRKFVGHGSLFN